jgi:hypothetical protein
MTEFLGYEMEQQTRTMIIDLLVALAVLTLIMVPSLCCQVSGPLLRPRDSWEEIYEKHAKEAKLKEKEKQALLKKKHHKTN